MEFTPVQRVVFKLVRGLPLDDVQKFPLRSFEPGRDGHSWSVTEHTEKSYVRKLYDEGRCNVSGTGFGTGFRDVTLVAGRRSGKTTIAGALCAHELRDHLGRDHDGALTFLSVTHSRDGAGIALRAMTDAALSLPEVAARRANDTAAYMCFQSDQDVRESGPWAGSQRQAKASLKLAARSAFAKGLRGSNLAFLCLDEVDAFYEGQAEDVWLSCRPGTCRVDGRIFVVGTPLHIRPRWFRKHYEDGKGLRLRIPTWELNPHVDARFLGEEYRRQGARFWAEFGACFMEEVCEVRPVGLGLSSPIYASPPPTAVEVRRAVTVDDLVAEMRRAVRGEKDEHDRVIDAYKAKVREAGRDAPVKDHVYERWVEHDILAGWINEFGQAEPVPQGSSPPDRVGEAMTLNEIGRQHQAWQDKNFDGISLLTQGLCLSEECGEVSRAIVKAHHGVRAKDRGNLAEELADVILVATSLATRAGIDLDAAVAAKAAKRDLKDFRARPETG